MTNLAKLLAAAAAVGAIAAPAAAQSPYPYQQPYQQPYAQPYAQPYGYQNNGGVVGQVIDSLLGNRYNVSDRQAISQCASAAVAQAAAQYRTNGYGNRQGYNQPYGANGYNNYATARVTAITDVQRRSSGLRVKGLLDSRGGYGAYGGQGYNSQNRGYAAGGGDLTFRCTIDYRGAVTDVRVSRNTNRY
jgi:hypothetical protein